MSDGGMDGGVGGGAGSVDGEKVEKEEGETRRDKSHQPTSQHSTRPLPTQTKYNRHYSWSRKYTQ